MVSNKMALISFLKKEMNSNTSIPSNTSTPINSGGNNTSTPLSMECEATLQKYYPICAAEIQKFLTVEPNISKELARCYHFDTCTPKQKEEYLKLYCPDFKKYYDCMKPVFDCQSPIESVTKPVRDCDAFSASGGSTNTTTSGNRTPTNTPTGKNDTQVTSAGISVRGSLIYIFAFALLL